MTKRAHSDVRVLRRDAATAAGSRVTGLKRCEVEPGQLECVPHVHNAEEEVFVVLEGYGEVELYLCGVADPCPEHCRCALGTCWCGRPAARWLTPSAPATPA